MSNGHKIMKMTTVFGHVTKMKSRATELLFGSGIRATIPFNKTL